MAASILVAYATKYGSTKEVADAVATTLRENGFQVESESVRNVGTIEGYDSVVIGAPLYMFRLHKDGRRFLSRHLSTLTKRPTAIFALGPFHDDEKERTEARGQLDKELEKLSALEPVSVEVFGGKFDPEALRFPFRLIPALRQMPASDVRDWEAIRSWANQLAGKLRPSSP